MWDYRAAVLRIIDADTYRLTVDTGFYMRTEIDIRLLGVSAPELGQPGSSEAIDYATLWFDSLDPTRRWPLHIRTTTTATAEPTEKRSFTRWVGTIADIAHPERASLNIVLADYLKAHPEWGSGQ